MTPAKIDLIGRKREAILPTTGEPRSSRRDRSRQALRIVSLVLVLSLLFSLAVWRRFLFFGNVDVIDSGNFIRAAQPKGNLIPLLDRYRPATVINLRGGSWNDPWYAAEAEEAEKRGIAFYDFPLSAVRRPSRKELLSLIGILDRSRSPILVHCKSGSDRTGLATGLYYLTRLKRPPDEAESLGFSIWRGHVPLFGPERLHEPFDEYAAWLAKNGLTHNPERFRRWVADDYADGEPRAKILPVRPGPRRNRPLKLKSS